MRLITTATLCFVSAAALLLNNSPAATALGVGTAKVCLPAAGVPLDPAADYYDPASTTDTDGDALPDVWEACGYDADGDGVVDVDLPKLGADPNHKDLFVEADYMPDYKPSTAVYDRVTAVFQKSPVSNPDKTTGIHIHIDGGPGVGGAYDLGGGNAVPQQARLLDPIEPKIAAIKADSFNPKRKRVFHYMVWADSYGTPVPEDDDQQCSSGVSLDIPADTFIVTMGNNCGWKPTEDMKVGTFIHELGHNLGLKHGGSDHDNWKPNYLSVMNYAFQFSGVPKTDGTFDFGYSSVNPAGLNENSLNERTGLGTVAKNYKTMWFCPGVGDQYTSHRTAGTANGPIDWNCDGKISTLPVATDINQNGTETVLTAQTNWSSLVFNGGNIGVLKATNRSAPDRPVEMTKADFDNLVRSLKN